MAAAYNYMLLVPIWVLAVIILLSRQLVLSENHNSAVGDPGMKREGLRVAFEAWNFCNEVGAEEAPTMGSPRAADCFDVIHSNRTNNSHGGGEFSSVVLAHRVTEADNRLGVGRTFSGLNPEAVKNPDLYAVSKEIYLGKLCRVEDDDDNKAGAWQFWMVMLKNGNFDTKSGLCPQNGMKVGPLPAGGKKFPCFGRGCMNQPLLYHQPTTTTKKILRKSRIRNDSSTPRKVLMHKGSFSGTYDLECLGKSSGEIARLARGNAKISYYQVVWEKESQNEAAGWKFKHKLQTSRKYPWLMLYLRADATSGFSGGYHYDTRGMLKILPKTPNFRVRLQLEVKQGGGPKSQFYLIDIGSCWKNDGRPCDGDVKTDVTRYNEMIINPETPAWCSATNLRACPPYHITPDGAKIHRAETARFPYDAYHYYCGPGNARHLEQPGDTCDPYSNPQPQEIVQILPHEVWREYGYPTKKGQGWVGDPRKWDLDVGGLSSRLYFYQDPGTKPAQRVWTSIDTGTEIFISEDGEHEVAEWTVSQFDVILTH